MAELCSVQLMAVSLWDQYNATSFRAVCTHLWRCPRPPCGVLSNGHWEGCLPMDGLGLDAPQGPSLPNPVWDSVLCHVWRDGALGTSWAPTQRVVTH